MRPVNSGSPEGGYGRDNGTQMVKAVVLIVVVVLIAIGILHELPKSSSPKTTSAVTTVPVTTVPKKSVGPTTTTTTIAVVPPAQVKLQVLNGVLTGSLAGEESAKLKASPGYDTLAPNNTTAKAPASVIYVVTSTFLPEAQALATTVGLPASAIQATTPASAPIPASARANANLILVIGPDLASKV